jgi:tetratricopeptide (TPR) repeat protein
MKNLLNLNKWLVASALVTVFTACDSRLDVEPTQTIDEAAALATEQDVRVTLTGAYDLMHGSNPNAGSGDLYAGAIQYTGELLGDDREVVFGGTFTTLDEIWRKTLTTVNGNVTSLWVNAYRSINTANNVLAALERVPQANRGNIEGQARFIRGSMYFELARFFGKQWGDGDNARNPAVPLVLEPTRSVTDADNRPRSTVAEVYAQAIQDLTRAEELLAVGNGNYAGRFAATAQLSRVYLQQGNYAAARDAANRVINSGRFALARNFADAFDENAADYGREHIYRTIVTDQDGTNSLLTFFAASQFQGRGDIRVQQRHLALYDAADIRRNFFYRAGVNTFTSKYRDRFGDVPILRITEMYLTRAECNARLNTSVGASPADDVNRIRTRAGLPILGAGTATVDAILRERRLELAFEGTLIHDLRRTRANVSTFPFNADRLVMPVPQREIDTNRNLVQNPGY